MSTGLTECIFQFVNKPTIYEITVYCLEKEMGEFYTEHKVFLL